MGPAHRGVYGRKAGTVPGYLYSEALNSASVVRTDKTLSLWLADPEKFIPGQKMGISVPDANQRAALIAYLTKASARQRAQWLGNRLNPGIFLRADG